MNSVTLVRYDAACKALADAKAVDEVKKIRDVSEAMRAYGRQAKNKQLEIDAAEIRIRAERRIGELMQAQRESVGLNEGAKGLGSNQYEVRVADGPTPPTLADAGIDKHMADRARKLAAVSDATFESEIQEWRTRVVQEGERVTTTLLREGERVLATRAINPPSNGLQFARLAIMRLEEIADDDTERQQAFDRVRSWLDAREA